VIGFWWDDTDARSTFETGTSAVARWITPVTARRGFQYSAFVGVPRTGHIQLRVEFARTDPHSPRVFSPPLGGSPHRNPDQSMCLWYPLHPPDQRWEFHDGLRELLVMAVLHLRREALWRGSAPRFVDRIWPGPEVPHGYQEGLS
jgi:hypothetical protein